MSDPATWVAVALGAGVVLAAVGGAAVIVAVVLRHRDVADLKAEATRAETATARHSAVLDEIHRVKVLTVQAIGGRAELERAVKDLAKRLTAQGGRLEEHSGSISELRERLGLEGKG